MSDLEEAPSVASSILEASGLITDEGVAELDGRVGYYYQPRPVNRLASADNIRLFCQAIGDSNPLYTDADYAATGPYGTLVAPPTFLYSVIHPTGMRVGGLPGVHAFHSGNEWEWFRPIYVDDVISGTYRPVKIVKKTSEMAGRSVIVYAEIVFRNLIGEVIARTLGWTIRVERRASKERGKYRNTQPKSWTPDELAQILAAYDEEDQTRRGSTVRYWEDVEVGDEIPRSLKGPLCMADITAWHGVGAVATAAHEYRLTELGRHPAFSFRDPSTGGLEQIARVHENAKLAEGAGVPGAYDLGAQRNAWLGTGLTNWMGDAGALVKLVAEYRRFNVFGDLQWGRGRVVGKREEGGKHLVDLDVWYENHDAVITTPGQAAVALPSRKSDRVPEPSAPTSKEVVRS